MIEACNLTKRFGQKVAVDDVSFTVHRGEVLGFLGPNGAGKSTTMRMLTGYLPPTAGTARIGGDDIIESSLSARKRIGYLPENAPVYHEMTVTGFLDFIAEIRGFSGTEKKQRVGDTIERCFLTEVRFQSIGTLSKGYKQRVCFAQGILHDPEYLIMDEPTDGLDPNQKHEVRGMIREMAKTKALIISTHLLEEMDAVCTRAIIIANGRIVADDTPEGLRAKSSNHGTVRLTVENLPEPEVLAGLEEFATVRTVENFPEGKLVTVRVYPADPERPPVDEVMSFLRERNTKVNSVSVEKGLLDEVFRAITTAAAEEVGS
jgi:ABC-2 type transport system ATP-binding protein